MKNTLLKIATLIVILLAVNITSAQINRTLNTKVVDILAQLPTKDLDHSNKLMGDIIDLNSEGILLFCDMLVPPGTGDDTQARYAINSLATFAGGEHNKIKENLVEKSLLIALQKASNVEIKTFLIGRLAFCGSNASLVDLTKYLSNNQLYNAALSTITTIGTKEAASSILKEAKNSNNVILPSLIVSLGNLRYAPALDFIQGLANSDSSVIKEKALTALAEIASAESLDILVEAAEKADYKLDDSKAILALIHYGNRLTEEGNTALGLEISKLLLDNCTQEDQLHFRTAGVYLLRENNADDALKTLLKEVKNKDKKYRAAVLDAASINRTASEVEKWTKVYKKMPVTAKPQLLLFLQDSNEAIVFEKCVLPAINDKNENVRIAGIKALVYQDKTKSLPVLFQSLKQATTSNEYKAIKETLLRVCNSDDGAALVDNMSKVTTNGQIVLVEVLAAKRASKQFNEVIQLLSKDQDDLNIVVYKSLKALSSSENLSVLLSLLETTKEEKNIKYVQESIVSAIDTSKEDNSKLVVEAYNKSNNKILLLPILPVVNNDEALNLVTNSLNSTDEKETQEALKVLANWRNNNALPYLFEAVNNPILRDEAFKFYLKQVGKSSYPADQKLLLVRKLMPIAKTNSEKKSIIKSAGNIKTFLSLIFVSEFIDNDELRATASNAVIKIALPTPGKKDALKGQIVREIVSNSVENLTGPDSQYIKIDVKEFLDKMSDEIGFESIFNGKDFTGWEGLVQNPIKRANMSKKVLAKAQKIANEQMLRDWFIKDGIIGFKGEGYNNICTIKDYGDFEMIVDWKITNGGDSGIYLRGTPQVQIWDIARTNVGAQVGSGGLYNNSKNERIPLVVADNPINDWNTFRIKMVGERVTVYLNGVLVTDNVVLENYWDRKLPIFEKEAIELQAHGEDLGFRNVYVREINSGDDSLSENEIKEGFKSLFNGQDLDQWIGNKKDYLVENNEIAVRPNQGGHGNLYTSKEYSDFIFRFEFKLTPGANNGLGIHTPLEGDAAYAGKELQILDDTAAIYANLKPYQYHGSVYGVIASKRGHLNPVGEWNTEEVIVKGDDIKITLNGVVIVEGNMKEASKNGPKDGKNHPGLKRNKGHIGFLGHGSELEFRKIRIKDLSK